MSVGGLSALFAQLREFAMPSGCVVCRDWIPAEPESARLVCGRCRTRMRSLPWPRCPRCHRPRGTGRAEGADCLDCRSWPAVLQAARSAYVLEGPVSDLVHALKYEGWRELADTMSEAMTEALGPIRGQMVAPVPTTARRLRERGYNQAMLLAEGVARRLRAPLVDLLVRAGDSGSQTSLSPRERAQNVREAFAPSADSANAVGRRVVLVDDVLTTGATGAAAARALERAGVASVTLLTFARALPEISRGAPDS